MAEKPVTTIVPVPTVRASRTSQAVSDAGVPAPPPLTLYVHLPWCIKKCPYCDFNSHQQPDDGVAQGDYIDALINDLELALPSIWGRTVHAIFIGGGTPSLFEPVWIERLLDAIRARVRLLADAEVTLEANPGTFEADRFIGFRQAGVTRLSIGVQSFNDDALESLGRVHSSHQALAAVELAATQFDTYNLDLMFALPGQTMAGLERDLSQVRQIKPPHFSCYHLTIEPNTLFARFVPPGLPDDDLAADMLDAVTQTAQGIGLERYEVSAYARDGHRCRHNLNYWQFGDYLGIGAGAHGKLSFHDRIIREQRYRHPARYMQAVADGKPIELTRQLGSDDLPFEFMLNALRLVDGVPSTLFHAHTGLNLTHVGDPVAKAIGQGLMRAGGDRLAPTDRGLQFLNDLQAGFL